MLLSQDITETHLLHPTLYSYWTPKQAVCSGEAVSAWSEMHIHTLDRDKVNWVGVPQWNKDMNKSLKQEVASPIQEVTSLGKDAVVGDQHAQCWAEHQNRWQQQVEMLSEHSVAQEVGYQVRHEHKRRVKEHLFTKPCTRSGISFCLRTDCCWLWIQRCGCSDNLPQNKQQTPFPAISL